MSKLFNIELECGCLIAEDSGTKNNPNGDSGMIPCYAEYGDLNKKKDAEKLALHNKCMDEYFK